VNSAETEPVDFRSSVELILSGDPDGLFNAANDLTRVSKSEAVEVLYRLAIEQGVKEAYLNYGLFLRDINRPKDALVQFEKAHAVGDPKAAYLLGETNWEMERHAEAIKWLRLAGSDTYVPLRLARSYRALGDEESAVKVLREGSETRAEAAVEYVHSKAGNPEKEIELLRRSVAEGEPNALHNLGLALWESGQTREGKALLKKAAQQGDKLSPKVLHNLRGKQRHIRLK